MAQSKTVKSPAGETIEIVPDDVWAETAGVTVRSIQQWGNGWKPAVVRALWQHGEFTDKSGRAANEIKKWIVKREPEYDALGLTGIVGAWRSPVNTPAVQMTMNGKRTFSIKLVAMPETWHRKMQREVNTQEPVKPVPVSEGGVIHGPEADAVPIVPIPADNGDKHVSEWTEADWDAIQMDAPTVHELPPPIELAMANQVAMSMLTQVVDIITAGTADTFQLSSGKRLQDELAGVQSLLALRLEENHKLRRQMRDAADTIAALKVERDGLRSRLRMTENNLAEVLKGDTARAVNEEIHKQIDKIMRQPPTMKGE